MKIEKHNAKHPKWLDLDIQNWFENTEQNYSCTTMHLNLFYFFSRYRGCTQRCNTVLQGKETDQVNKKLLNKQSRIGIFVKGQILSQTSTQNCHPTLAQVLSTLSSICT